jgi:hypothetical protein
MKPMQLFSRSLLLVLSVLLALAPPAARAQKNMYLAEIRKAAEKGWREMPATLEAWKRDPRHSVLWGYNAPAQPLYLAGVYGYLYEVTHEPVYATRAAKLLTEYGSLRDILPAGFAGARAEYADGVPAVSNFFFLPPFARAYMQIRSSDAVNATNRSIIERDLAGSIDFIFRFPEWGAHNRAMLRAEAFQYASQALPEHPHARRWKQMAEAIAADNLRHWEIEDATVYHPVWLHALLSYAGSAGRQEVHSSVMMRYYMEYFTRLMAPSGLVPDFGDAYWVSSLEGLRFVAIFERGAAVFQNPAIKWAAATIFQTRKNQSDTLSIGDAYYLCDAHRWTDETVKPKHPGTGSEEVLEDLIGKKVVFRNGWDSTSTYLLLNYRDEGDGGWLGREYLRQTLSVEEEKMHHGHADENSIALLMDKGSVLLHDAGYRDGLPSGAYGGWRQDYFHNRLVARKDKRDMRQGMLEYVQNSGAYRNVRTQKVDFVRLRDVDMSRTRLIDQELGYTWDRVIAYVRATGVFLVIDGIKALRPDYFTFANFWHAGQVDSVAPHVYRAITDSIGPLRVAGSRALRIEFLENTAKSEGIEPISRAQGRERALYQTLSSQYKAGDTELFITALVPQDRKNGTAPVIRLQTTSAPMRAAGIILEDGNTRYVVGVKMDLEMEVARGNIRPRYTYDLGKVHYGEYETDAHFFCATERTGTPSWSAVNVLKVKHRGVELMSALPNTHSLQLDGSADRVGMSKWRVWEE